MYTLMNHELVVSKGSFMQKLSLIKDFVVWEDLGEGFIGVKQVKPSSTVENILNRLAKE